MKIAKKIIELKEHEPLIFYVLGDIHEGSASVDYKALPEAIDIIKKDIDEGKKVFIVLMGDLIDAIISQGDPRFSPAEIDKKYFIQDLTDLPKIQAGHIFQYLKPIADHVWVVMLGNHEKEYIKRHAYDVYNNDYRIFFPNADFLGYMGMYRLMCNMKSVGGEFKIDFVFNHGPKTVGGFREGYPINKVHDFFRWFIADFKIMGHIHKLVADRKQFCSLNYLGDGMIVTESWYGISGTFMLTYKDDTQNYFEDRVGTLSDIGMLKGEIILSRHMIDGVRRFQKHLKLEKIFLR